MTTSTDNINTNILQSEFFTEFSAAFAEGTSIYNNIERRARETQRFMNILQASGITKKIDRPIDTFKYRYSTKAKGGHASLKGGGVASGNPNIVVEQIEHTIQGVRSKTYAWDTKFTECDWDRVWQVIRLQNDTGIVDLSEVMDFEYIAQHIIRGCQARNYWYLDSLLNGEFILLNDFEKDVPSREMEKFSIQNKYLSQVSKKFSFLDLLTYEQILQSKKVIEDETSKGIITDYKESFPQVELIVYVPKTIYKHCLNELINKNFEGQNAMLFGYLITDPYNNEFKIAGLGSLATHSYKVAAEHLPKQFKIKNMLVVSSDEAEEWQMYEQDPAKTQIGRKTHKIFIATKQAFRYSNPESKDLHEFRRNNPTSISGETNRRMMVTPFYNVELEMRRESAVNTRRRYDTTLIGAHGHQELIPINLDYAGAFEIDSAATLGITQAQFEAQMSGIDNQAKAFYSELFYNAKQTDENLEFLKPIV